MSAVIDDTPWLVVETCSAAGRGVCSDSGTVTSHNPGDLDTFSKAIIAEIRDAGERGPA